MYAPRDWIDPTTPDYVRRPTAAEAADVAAMHDANAAAWDEAAERYEALVRRGGRADPLRRDEPVRRRDRADRRPPRPLPPGDPPPVRRRSGHAVAVEPRGGRGRRRRLQPAHARRSRERLTAATGAPARWIRVRRPRHAARARRDRRPRLHRPRLAHLAAGPRRLGRGRRPAAGAGRPVRPVRRASGRVAVRCRRGRSLDRDRLRLLRRRRGVEGLGARVHRPPVDRRGRAELEVRPGVDARRGRHGAARRRPAARGGRRAPDRLVGRPRRRARRGSRPGPAVVLGRRPARLSGPSAWLGRPRGARQPGCSPANRPSEARSTRAISTIAAGAIGAVDVRIRRARDRRTATGRRARRGRGSGPGTAAGPSA